MKIDELKTLPVTHISTHVEMMKPSDTLSKAIGLLRESGQYQVLLDDGARTGIVSIRDILDHANISTTKLANIMQYVPRLGPNNTVGDASTIMFDYRIRALPVFEDGELKGQITTKSIIKKMMEKGIDVKASRIMTPHPICLNKSDSASKARRIMVRRKIDQLPVLDEGKVHSVVTSSSMVFKLLPSVDRLKMYADWRVGRLSLPAVRFVTDSTVINDVTDSIETVFRNMSRHGTTYSIVTSFDEIHGIVTFGDYMRLLVKRRNGGIVPMYMIGLPDDPFEAEAARSKFTRVIRLLRTSFPDMLEARAIIKSGITKAPRRRYQVKVFVSTPDRRYSYSAFGFELPDLFDRIVPWSKSILERHITKRERVRVEAGYTR